MATPVKELSYISCNTDTDCSDKMGCCMMVDPGSVPVDNLKQTGFPTTKSKMCSNALAKGILDAQRLAKQPE
jgi:hypothetical protein